MAQKSSYAPVSGFWALFVPGVIGGVTFYVYNTHGYVSTRVRAIIDPVMGPVVKMVTEFLPY